MKEMQGQVRKVRFYIWDVDNDEKKRHVTIIEDLFGYTSVNLNGPVENSVLTSCRLLLQQFEDQRERLAVLAVLIQQSFPKKAEASRDELEISIPVASL